MGLESGNPQTVAERDLPWLQDVAGVDVWETWAVGYRDVWILDRDNRLVGVYNLTEHDLNDAASFEELKSLFIEASLR